MDCPCSTFPALRVYDTRAILALVSTARFSSDLDSKSRHFGTITEVSDPAPPPLFAGEGKSRLH